MSTARILAITPAAKPDEADEKAEAPRKPPAGFSVTLTIDTPLVLGKLIASGSYGSLYNATYQGFKMAVKRLKTFNAHAEYQLALRVFHQEVHGLRAIQPYNLRCGIQYYGHREVYPHDIFLELVEGRDLGAIVKSYHDQNDWNQTYRMPALTRADLATKCLEAGVELAANKILHCDLKPANIMLTTKGEIKVVDWAFMRFLGENKCITLLCQQGSMDYSAYEQLFNLAASPASEVYSWGGVIYALAYGNAPYYEVSDFRMEYKVRHAIPATIPEGNPEYGTQIAECWQKDPDKRPAISALHKYFALLRESLSAPAAHVDVLADTLSTLPLS